MDHASRRPNVEALLEEAAWVRRLVARLVTDAGAAEDVVQETWVAAIEADRSTWGVRVSDARRGPFDRGGAGLRAWLAAVARNLALRRRRQDATRQRFEVRSAAARGEDQPGSELGRMQLQRALADAIIALDDSVRSCVVQRHLDIATYAEIAAHHGISEAAARKRVSRGLAALRTKLDAVYGGEEAWCAVAFATLGAASSGAGASSGPTGSLLPGGSAMGTKAITGAVAATLAAGLFVYVGFFSSVENETRETAASESRPRHAVSALPPVDEDESPGGPADSMNALPSIEREVTREAIAQHEASGAHAVEWCDVTVTDVAGVPLAGARLAFDDGLEDDVEELRTGSDGRARVTLPKSTGRSRADSPRLVASCEGYVSRAIRLDTSEPRVIALQTVPFVSGRLLDVEGRPIASRAKVSVRVVDRETGEERHFDSVVRSDATFRVESPRLGRLIRVKGIAEGFVENEFELDVELIAGAEHVVDVVLERGVRVTGTVVDAITKEPIPGARVWADEFGYDTDSYHPHAVADAAGRFELDGTEARPHLTDGGHEYMLLSVSAESDGYSSERFALQAVGREASGEYEIEVAIDPTACELSGVVYRAGGTSPADGVFVYVIDSLRQWKYERTNRDGRFRFENMAPGGIALLCRYGGFTESIGCETLLWSGEVDSTAPRVLELELRAPKGSARGRVLDSAGDPVAGARVGIRFRLRSGAMTIGIDGTETTTDAGGYYVFEELPAGAYGISVQPGLDSLASQPEAHKFDMEPAQSLEELDFVVGPAIAFAGVVAITGEGSPRELVVRLVPTDDARRDRDAPEVRLGDDGGFRFDGVLAGRYVLELRRGETTIDSQPLGPSADERIFLRADLP